jgi:hypothetical protein
MDFTGVKVIIAFIIIITEGLLPMSSILIKLIVIE